MPIDPLDAIKTRLMHRPARLLPPTNRPPLPAPSLAPRDAYSEPQRPPPLTREDLDLAHRQGQLDALETLARALGCKVTPIEP